MLILPLYLTHFSSGWSEILLSCWHALITSISQLLQKLVSDTYSLLRLGCLYPNLVPLTSPENLPESSQPYLVLVLHVGACPFQKHGEIQAVGGRGCSLRDPSRSLEGQWDEASFPPGALNRKSYLCPPGPAVIKHGYKMTVLCDAA